ncbi:MAG: hypothetical protein LH631_06325 [Alkalinema sp. CAN_BIN05]|nr:hypothetical protein [Alkalinema sp. CAN_BIN05]
MTEPKPPNVNPKQIGNFTICFCIGMAYFNTFSTLNIDPALSGPIAAGPIALFAAWKLGLFKPKNRSSIDSDD